MYVSIPEGFLHSPFILHFLCFNMEYKTCTVILFTQIFNFLSYTITTSLVSSPSHQFRSRWIFYLYRR